MERHKQTQETRDKISRSLREQWRAGLRRPPRAKGYRMSDEQKLKIGRANSISLKGRTITDIAIARRTKSRLGFRHTAETKRRIAKSNVIAHTGKALSVETRRKLSATHRARREQSHLWKGGVTPLHQALRNSVDMRIWREEVFKRDNYTCRNCRARGGRLEAHHIKPFSSYPSHRFDVGNGMTLCKKCHGQTDSYGVRASKSNKRE
jgi:hypothetical protein